MKASVKSSITLPPDERKLVERLRKRTAAKSNVEVVRRGLKLLESNLDRDDLRERFRAASESVAKVNSAEMKELDQLSSENLSDED